MGFTDKIVSQKREELDKQTAQRIQELGEVTDVDIWRFAYGKHPRQFVDKFACPTETDRVMINIHGGGLIMGDNSQNQWLNAWVAKQGFDVCAIEYRLVPEVLMMDQVHDIINGMREISRRVPSNKKFYVMADSAGALLAMYAIACQKSERIARLFGVQHSADDPEILGVAFQSGMFYTTRFDDVGLFMSRLFYGKDCKKKYKYLYRYLSHPEMVISLMPRCILSTSKDDFKYKYTRDMFFNGLFINPFDIVYLDDDGFGHAFNALYPETKEAQSINTEMIDFITGKEI